MQWLSLSGENFIATVYYDLGEKADTGLVGVFFVLFNERSEVLSLDLLRLNGVGFVKLLVSVCLLNCKF